LNGLKGAEVMERLLHCGFAWIPPAKPKIFLKNKERFPFTDNGQI